MCSRGCTEGSPFCEPLSLLQLRLSDAVLENPESYGLLAIAAGSVVQGCDPRGPGLLWNSTALQNMTTMAPSSVRVGAIVSTAGWL